MLFYMWYDTFLTLLHEIVQKKFTFLQVKKHRFSVLPTFNSHGLQVYSYRSTQSTDILRFLYQFTFFFAQNWYPTKIFVQQEGLPRYRYPVPTQIPTQVPSKLLTSDTHSNFGHFDQIYNVFHISIIIIFMEKFDVAKTS